MTNNNVAGLQGTSRAGSRPKLTVDAAVCAVGPAAALLRLVDLDVGHIQGVRVQTLHLQPTKNKEHEREPTNQHSGMAGLQTDGGGRTGGLLCARQLAAACWLRSERILQKKQAAPCVTGAKH